MTTASDIPVHTAGKRAQGSEALLQSDRRLEHLYAISKSLVRLHSVPQMVTEVMNLAARVVPLKGALLLLERAGLPPSVGWPGEQARAHATTRPSQQTYSMHRYLIPEAPLRAESGMAVNEAASRTSAPGPRIVESGHEPIVLPLVVEHDRIFGTLQLERRASFDEADLAFVNAVANQLAVALDRQATAASAATAARRVEQAQRLLAELGTTISCSLDRRATLAAAARCAVPLFADLCIIDELAEDGTLQRSEVVFADPHKQAALADRVRRFASPAGWITPQTKVLESGQPMIVMELVDALAEGLAPDDEHAQLFRDAGAHSMIAVALQGRGRKLGALTFVLAESGRRYAGRDLLLAQEFAGRVASAIDNADLYEHAQSATRARQDLLSVVSHDLKSPLNSIALTVSVLLKLAEGADRRKSSRKQLELIHRATWRMNHLINDLLDMASIESSHLSITPVKVDAPVQIAEAIEALEPMAASRSVKLVSELPVGLAPLRVDADRLQQLLGNLLGNAVKFSPPGATVSVRAQPDGAMLRISVSDSGPGIPPGELAHLFKRFWQVKRTAALGTGLGLFISKGIVEAHGGKIWVESTVGVGSTFFVTLPIHSLPASS